MSAEPGSITRHADHFPILLIFVLILILDFFEWENENEDETPDFKNVYISEREAAQAIPRGT